MVNVFLKDPPQYEELSRMLRHFIFTMRKTPTEIAQQIVDKYASLPDEDKEGRSKLSAVMAQLFDFLRPEYQAELMRTFDITTDGIHSISEFLGATILGFTGRETMHFSEQLRKGPVAPTSTKLPDIPYLGHPDDLSNVVKLNCRFWNEEGLLVAWRDWTHSIMLAVFCNQKNDILIDEEGFMDQPPRYFTSSTHFISPVYYVLQAKKVLLRVLELIGYPLLDVKTKVLFTHPEATLINREDYDADGYRHDEWEGTRVCERRKMNRKPFIEPTLPLVGAESDTRMNAMDSALMLSLAATSHILDSLHYFPQVIRVSNQNIDKRCESLEILTPILNINHDD